MVTLNTLLSSLMTPVEEYLKPWCILLGTGLRVSDSSQTWALVSFCSSSISLPFSVCDTNVGLFTQHCPGLKHSPALLAPSHHSLNGNTLPTSFQHVPLSKKNSPPHSNSPVTLSNTEGSYRPDMLAAECKENLYIKYI